MAPRSFRYPISPLQAVVLIHNVLHCPDAENDADRTVEELVGEIDTFKGSVSKGVLEAALYACNMNDENDRMDKNDKDKVPGVKFWHPNDHDFDRFLRDVIPHGQRFHKYYNFLITNERDEDGHDDKDRR
jgi:hypothetical protein